MSSKKLEKITLTDSSSPPSKRVRKEFDKECVSKPVYLKTANTLQEKMQSSAESNGVEPMEVDSNGSSAAVVNGSSSHLAVNRQGSVLSSGEHIDEGLYSRQLYVLGHEAMRRMAKTNILICGMGGLGVEIAKNMILSGVKAVTVHDSENVSWNDLSAQFYLSENDVGKNRATMSVKHLMELNSYVKVDASTATLTDEFLKKYQIVILTNPSQDEQERISRIVRSHNNYFIIAKNYGVFGSVFCDFGKGFVVIDTDGEPPKSVLISGITHDEEGLVTCHDDTRHNLEDGDHVSFDEIQGMVELNKHAPIKIKVKGPFTFSIGDTTKFSPYKTGGVVTQVKMPKTIDFLPLEQALNNPEYNEMDFGKFGRSQQLHLGFMALQRFRGENNGNLPRPWNREDAEKFLNIMRNINSSASDNIKLEELDEKVLSKLAFTARGNLAPMCSVIGSIVAQEAMKACSGKFMPIKQFAYFDATETLPNSLLSEADCAPSDCRYDGQIAVFGKQFQDKLAATKYFIVGAGAIGCELLKNFAMMGVAGKPGGMLYVTDMDSIEKSNLNRQFLFRPWDVSKMKSDVAADAVKRMNPNIHVMAHQNRVGGDTENIYNDEFFEKLDGVANALDNVDARMYMDRRCVFYCKPLLESGTQGTKGNVQVVIPHMTESYSSSQDPPEKSIPICTLKNFPNAIEHTLQWARELFEGVFVQEPDNARQFLDDPQFLNRVKDMPGVQPMEVLETVKRRLIDDCPTSFENCIEKARFMFQDYYFNQISQLLYNFPPDQKTSSGAPFWSGPKRCPEPIPFDASNVLHIDFIVAVANLYADVYGIPQSRDIDKITQIAAAVKAPAFVPRADVKIATTEAEASTQASNNGSSNDSDLNDLLNDIMNPKKVSNIAKNIKMLDFEKDDDSNFHMDFIVAASNLRATNYSIPPADRHKSKLIAGKIIPAIATTTSLVSGLVMFEFYKLRQGHNTLEAYKNAFLNLALPFFCFSDPIQAAKADALGKEWTLWDRYELQGDMTMREVVEYFQNEHKLEITMLSQGVSMLYSFFMTADRKKARLDMKVQDAVVQVTGNEIAPHVRSLVLEMCCNGPDGEDVDVPFIKYVLPKN